MREVGRHAAKDTGSDLKPGPHALLSEAAVHQMEMDPISQ